MLLAFDDLKLVGEAGDGDDPGPMRANSARCDFDGHGDAGNGWHRRHGCDPGALPANENHHADGFVEDSVVQNALKAGAIGYLLKNIAINTLANAIRFGQCRAASSLSKGNPSAD